MFSLPTYTVLPWPRPETRTEALFGIYSWESFVMENGSHKTNRKEKSLSQTQMAAVNVFRELFRLWKYFEVKSNNMSSLIRCECQKENGKG
jgi:hypothetical protein